MTFTHVLHLFALDSIIMELLRCVRACVCELGGGGLYVSLSFQCMDNCHSMCMDHFRYACLYVFVYMWTFTLKDKKQDMP